MHAPRRLFGTDGVRGIANTELTCNMAYNLGQAAVLFLGKDLVIGKDTRRSGDMLEAALISGIMSAGGTAHLAGIIPTPAIALLSREKGYDGGVVISASHNPPRYNGIKFFTADGCKLGEETQQCFEDYLQGALMFERSAVDELLGRHGHLRRLCNVVDVLHDQRSGDAIVGAAVGCVEHLDDALDLYISHAVETVGAIDFSGLVVAVDCAHGASWYTTPEALRRLGATIHVMNADYNGSDINVACGSTNLGALSAFVRECHADLGIAHDGDADRLLAVDADGNILDGDVIGAICAVALKARGQLAHNTIVSTVMSNLGFKKAMEAQGIHVEETPVGDRHVLESMLDNGYVLGGEQSGHTIFLDYNSTGDGLITAVQLIAEMKRSGKTLAELATVMTRYPQVLINVPVANKGMLSSLTVISEAVLEAEEDLKGEGRVLVRASGTEPLVRVMIEAKDQAVAEDVARRIALVVEREFAV
jgi:phosphoglucosamine mutase